MNYIKSKIIINEEISPGIFKMVVEDKNSVKPGQFYMLKINGATTLPRPISICEKDNETITFVYAVIGKGTEEFSKLNSGEYINLTGPLGNGFNIEEKLGKVALVCGGIGTAPMLLLARKLREKYSDMKLDLFAGFRDDIYLIDKLNDYVNECNVSTNSGNHGHKDL